MKKDRQRKILQILTEKGTVEVVELSKALNVSQVTIRKDLDALESMHMIKRIHGYATLDDTDDINGRLAYHYEEKMKIAAKAAELIHDGDTVMIENGSCCALAARLIGGKKKNVTIVTNSAFIADFIRKEQVNIVLLGGIYQNDSQCLVGPMIRDGAMNYHVKYCLCGADGWSEKTGFTNKDQLRAQAVRDISGSCEHVVVLTESEKFKRTGTVPLNVPRESTIVITDSFLEDSVKKVMESQGMEVLLTE